MFVTFFPGRGGHFLIHGEYSVVAIVSSSLALPPLVALRTPQPFCIEAIL